MVKSGYMLHSSTKFKVSPSRSAVDDGCSALLRQVTNRKSISNTQASCVSTIEAQINKNSMLHADMKFLLLVFCFSASISSLCGAGLSDICLKCKCHWDLQIIYCETDNYIEDDDKAMLGRFNKLILENTSNQEKVLRLKTIITVHERRTQMINERRKKCENMIYTMAMCVSNKDIPNGLCKKEEKP